MNKICTDLEQSKKLVELGIDASTADMHYAPTNNGREVSVSIRPYQEAIDGQFIGIIPRTWEIIPAWSLSSLLELVPIPYLSGNDDNTWTIASYKSDSEFEPIHLIENVKTPIDAVFTMICWLKENKYI